MSPYPNTTKEEIEDFDRKVKENVEKYYKDRFWSTLAKYLNEELELAKKRRQNNVSKRKIKAEK